jgi:DNA-binding XRE family transcriptional regulator
VSPCSYDAQGHTNLQVGFSNPACAPPWTVRSHDGKRVLYAVGRRVAELRTGLHLTQDQLASSAGVSVKYVQRIEAGTENLTVLSLVRLANLLKVEVGALFDPPTTGPSPRGRPRRTVMGKRPSNGPGSRPRSS